MERPNPKDYLPMLRRLAGHQFARLPLGALIEEGDLMSAGYLGLVEAVERWDGARSFVRYASGLIVGRMVDEIRRWDRVRRQYRKMATRYEAAAERLEKEHERTPTHSEVIEAAGINPEAERSLAAYVGTVSLDKPIRPSRMGGDTLLDGRHGLVPSDETDPCAEMDRATAKGIVRWAVGELQPDHRLPVRGYYFEGINLKDIGEEVGGVTEAAICHRIKKARATLYEMLKHRRCELLSIFEGGGT